MFSSLERQAISLLPGIVTGVERRVAPVFMPKVLFPAFEDLATMTGNRGKDLIQFKPRPLLAEIQRGEDLIKFKPRPLVDRVLDVLA